MAESYVSTRVGTTHGYDHTQQYGIGLDWRIDCGEVRPFSHHPLLKPLDHITQGPFTPAQGRNHMNNFAGSSRRRRDFDGVVQRRDIGSLDDSGGPTFLALSSCFPSTVPV